MAAYIVRWRNALADFDMSAEAKAREVDMLSPVLGRLDAANNRRIIAGICQLVIGAGLVCLCFFSWKLVGIVLTAATVAVLEVALAILLMIGMAGVLKMWAVSAKVQGLLKPTKPDADIVEFLAPLSESDYKWEPDVRVSPTVATLRTWRACRASKRWCRRAGKRITRAVLDAFLIALNVAAFLGYGAIPLDVFFPDRSVLIDWLPPGERVVIQQQQNKLVLVLVLVLLRVS
eukprot:jgi/Undpi1/11132/HiC_scaffold_30.g13430.m1